MKKILLISIQINEKKFLVTSLNTGTNEVSSFRAF
jgi:hypothetical protein